MQPIAARPHVVCPYTVSSGAGVHAYTWLFSGRDFPALVLGLVSLCKLVSKKITVCGLPVGDAISDRPQTDRLSLWLSRAVA